MTPEEHSPLVFDRQGIRAIDAMAIAEGISGLTLMERAAQGAAEKAMAMTEAGASICIVCGTGNNGGDGWAVARLLHEHDRAVCVVAHALPSADTDAYANAQRTTELGIDVRAGGPLPPADLLIDGLLGTGFTGTLHDAGRMRVEAINVHAAPVLALDLPSGLDADTGLPAPVAVYATHTVTFGGMKLGLSLDHASTWTGPVDVIDLGVPRAVLHQCALPSSNLGGS